MAHRIVGCSNFELKILITNKYFNIYFGLINIHWDDEAYLIYRLTNLRMIKNKNIENYSIHVFIYSLQSWKLELKELSSVFLL